MIGDPGNPLGAPWTGPGGTLDTGPGSTLDRALRRPGGTLDRVWEFFYKRPAFAVFPATPR